MSSKDASIPNSNFNSNSIITLKFIPIPLSESIESEHAKLKFYQANPSYGPFCLELGVVPSEATLTHQINSLTLSTLLNEYQRIAFPFSKPPVPEYLEVPDVVAGFRPTAYGCSTPSTAYKLRSNTRAAEKSVDAFLERFPYILHQVYYPSLALWASKTGCKTVEEWSKFESFKSPSNESSLKEWYESAIYAQVLRAVKESYKLWESFGLELFVDFVYNEEMEEYARSIQTCLQYKSGKPPPPHEKSTNIHRNNIIKTPRDLKLLKLVLWKGFFSHPIPIRPLESTSSTINFLSHFFRSFSENKSTTQIRAPLSSPSSSVVDSPVDAAGVASNYSTSFSSPPPSKVSSTSIISLEQKITQIEDEERIEEHLLKDSKEKEFEGQEKGFCLRRRTHLHLPSNISKSDSII